MADIGNSTVYIGSPDWYIGDPESYRAVVDSLDPPAAQYGVNATVRFIPRGAYSPDPLGDRLFYDWVIQARPSKSISRLKVNNDEARLELDTLGIYTISLTVSGANGGAADDVLSLVVAQPASVAYSGGIEYDVSWIWRTLSDFWSTLERKDLLRIEAIWQGLQSLVGADLLDVFNAKDSIAINTLQATIFRKWIPFDLTLDITGGAILFNTPIERISRVSETEVRVDMSTLQQRYDAKLLKNNALLVPGIVPQPFDVGRPARITNVATGWLADIKIVGTNSTNGVPTFTIPPQNVQSSELPLDYDLRLYTTSYIDPTIFEVDGAFVLSSGGAPGHRLLNITGALPTSISVPAQIKYADAALLGISAGDVIEAVLQDEVSRETITVLMDVLAVAGDIVAVSFREDVRTYLSQLYEEDVVDILSEDIQSAGWRARHSGAWLNSKSLFQIGVGGQYKKHISIMSATLYRRTRIPIDTDVRALFKLTSRITRVTEAGSGWLTSAENEVYDAPIDLYENSDFYVRRAQDVGYRLRTLTLNEFSAEGYDFSIARIEPGQQLIVTSGLGTGAYTITAVNADSVMVSPPSPSEFYDATFFVQSSGAYLELGSTDLHARLVPRLWAEYAVYDNSARIENVFGSAVGLRRELWESLNNRSSYRDAVASIIKTRVTASTVEAIDNVVSLALGIAVAPYRSVIRDIDNEYRTDLDGNPTEYHVVLEEIVDEDTRTGRVTTHEVSASSGLRLGATSGMATNPSTGTKYVIGDTIEQYASIGEGVRVVDLYTTDMTFALHDIIDRHRFAVLVDVDSVSGLAANPEKLSLMRSLIFETKPSYTTFFIRLLKFLVDYIDIEEDIFIKLRARLYDNPYHHRGPANIYDDSIPGTSDRDEPAMLPLTTWFPRDGVISEVDMAVGSFLLTSSTGGFVTPTRDTGAGRFNPTGIYPWIQAGDFVEFRSDVRTKIRIDEVVSDTQLRVSVVYIEDRIQVGGLPTTNAGFFVYRTLRDHVLTADIDVPLEGDRLTLSFLGQASTNLGIGDIVTISTADGVETGRLRLLETQLDPITGLYNVSTYPPVRGLSGTSTGTVRVFRELIRDRRIEGTVFPSRQGSPFIDIGQSAFTYGLDVGDMLDIEGAAQTRIVGICANRVFTESPLPLIPTTTSFESYRIDTNTGADDLDEQELAVGSSVQIVLHNVRMKAFPDGRVSSINGLLNPGDIIVAPITLDLGEGEGIVRVCAESTGGTFFTNLVDLAPEELSLVPARFTCSLIRQDALHSDYFFTDRSVTEVTWGNVRTRP